jgi:hypothetical protein
LRLTRRSLLIGGGAIAAASAAGAALAQRPQAFRDATPVPVTAEPIGRLSVTDPDRTRFGALVFRSGLDLKSSASAFGGFSGLWRSENGRDLIALADNAQWLKARIVTADGHLAGLTDAVMAPLLLSTGTPLRRTRYYDTESIAISGQEAFVGIERNHAVIRFERDRGGALVRGVPLSAPQGLSDLPANGGLEAIGVAPRSSPLAGALVAIAEGQKGFILTGPRRGSFDVVRSSNYDVTDLAFLPDGDLLLLERRFALLGGLGCRLRRMAAGGIAPGARVDGEIVYESDGSHQVDNMEGLAVHREGRETVVTLISDNNFNTSLQRTLLLEFALAG